MKKFKCQVQKSDLDQVITKQLTRQRQNVRIKTQPKVRKPEHQTWQNKA